MTEAPDGIAEDVAKVIHDILMTPNVATPTGYDLIDLSLLDAVFSLGVKYGAVENLLARYRKDPGASGTVTGLLNAIRNCGGPEGFAAKVRNHNLTSPRSGTLKAEAVRDVAEILKRNRIDDKATFVQRYQADDLHDVKVDWLGVTGQSKGTSWRYFLILNGIEEVKPDRMIQRFVRHAVGRKVDADEAGILVTAAAQELGESIRHVDHRIWRFERSRPKKFLDPEVAATSAIEIARRYARRAPLERAIPYLNFAAETGSDEIKSEVEVLWVWVAEGIIEARQALDGLGNSEP